MRLPENGPLRMSLFSLVGLLAIIAAVAVVEGAFYALLPRVPNVYDLVFGSRFVRTCEEKIRERLLSPSSYRRVSVYENDEPISNKDYAASHKGRGFFDTEEGLKQLQSYGGPGPSKHQAFVSYDAPNRYGVMIRGTSICEITTNNGDYGTWLEFSILVDGQSNADWTLDQVRDQIRAKSQ